MMKSPIVGDQRYGQGLDDLEEDVEDSSEAANLYLWALSVAFKHPSSQEWLQVELEEPEMRLGRAKTSEGQCDENGL